MCGIRCCGHYGEPSTHRGLGSDQTVCADVPVLLDATVPGATYLWQDGSTGATFAPTVSGPYSVTVTLNNCVASDATNITFTPAGG
ncbi:MAG: hypothetical protein IPO87_12765 [Flavobacteriales bacterium]|nr:hypothetical protein [Flavobacteriales bacterium]